MRSQENVTGKARDIISSLVNKSIAPLGLELVRCNRHDWSDVANFIPFDSTIKGASLAGLSPGDYIDTVWNKTAGAAQATIDNMRALGVFSDETQSVVEIGPGTGRYLEKTLKACCPSRYEVYETAEPWAAYVAQTYNVLRQPTDGESLTPTPTASVNLVHAHKVFSTIPFLATSRYWVEMVRVARPGGYAVFDIVTEECLTPEAIESWAKSGIHNGSYPALIPRKVALGYFDARDFDLIGSFFVPMLPGKTQTFVFKKRDHPHASKNCPRPDANP